MTENQPLRLCLMSGSVLHLTLFWPSKDELFKFPRRFYLRVTFFVLTLGLSVGSGIFMHCFRSLQEGEEIGENLAQLISVIGSVVVTVQYAMNQQNLIILLKDMSNFGNFGKPPSFDKLNQKLDRFVKFIAYSMALSATGLALWSVISMPECRKKSKIGEVCGTIMLMWTPLNVNDWVFVVFVYIVIVSTSIAHLMVPCQLMEITCNLVLRIDHLKSMFLICFDEDFVESKQRVRFCMRYHMSIIVWSNKLNACFTSANFTYLITEGIILGLVENQFSKEFNFLTCVHFVYYFTVLFVSCVAGHMLMDSSFSVKDAAYNSKWYYADIDVRRNLILVIMRSQKPLFLSTGAFGVLTLGLFAAILKMSYSVFTLFH